MTVKTENAYSTDVNSRTCCSCEEGFIPDGDECKALTCADTDGSGSTYVCGDGAAFSTANSDEPFSFTACCVCLSGYVFETGAGCVVKTCTNVDGEGTDFECGWGYVVDLANAISTVVTRSSCCTCAEDFVRREEPREERRSEPLCWVSWVAF